MALLGRCQSVSCFDVQDVAGCCRQPDVCDLEKCPSGDPILQLRNSRCGVRVHPFSMLGEVAIFHELWGIQLLSVAFRKRWSCGSFLGAF